MNWTGRIVLLLAIATSVTLFWRKFGRVLRIILDSKPDADFQLRPIGPRIRKVLWEVGAQGLVIAGEHLWLHLPLAQLSAGALTFDATHSRVGELVFTAVRASLEAEEGLSQLATLSEGEPN